MKNKIRIELEDNLYYVRVNGKKMSIRTAADIFRIRMLNTMNAMGVGKVSKAIEIIVKEVKP